MAATVIDFTVDVGPWMRGIVTSSGRRLLPEPAIRIYRGDADFEIDVLSAGSKADLTSTDASELRLVLKDPDALDGADVLAQSSSVSKSGDTDHVLAITMETATAEMDTFLGSETAKNAVLELALLDDQGDLVAPLAQSVVQVRASAVRDGDTEPATDGPETGLGDVGTSLEIDFDGRSYLRGNADQSTLSLTFANTPPAPAADTDPGTVRTVELLLTNTSGGDCTVTVPTGVYLATGQIMDSVGSRELTFADGDEMLLVIQGRDGKVLVDLSIYEEET